MTGDQGSLWLSGGREVFAISGRDVKDFVNLSDLAPTFIEAAGADVPSMMTANSLMKIFSGQKNE